MNLSNNEKELFYVFIPNIIYGFIWELVDNQINDKNEFNVESAYFRRLYLSKLLSLFMFILAIRFFKDYVPKYSIVLIAYLFNILLIISDNTNISEYIELRKDLPDTTFYKTFNLRIYLNYVFLAIWMLIILAKTKSWIKKLKSVDIEAKEHTE
jgi:hypothetical protein